MNVFVIGGTGFIGSATATRLVQDNHEVHVAHRGITSTPLPQSVRTWIVNRDDLDRLTSIARTINPDVTVDLVSYTADHARCVTHAVNTCGSQLVTISSADVYRNYDGLRHRYGDPPDPVPLTEDAPVRERLYPYRDLANDGPAWIHDYEKLEVERVVRETCETSATILRLGKVYGPKDPQDHVGDYLRRIARYDADVALEVGQGQWRWTRAYVDDVAAAIAVVVDDVRSRGRRYNVGEPDALTEAAWFHTLGAMQGHHVSCHEVPIDCLPTRDRIGREWTYKLELSTEAIRRELGYTEPIGRLEGIRMTVAAMTGRNATG